MFFFSYHIGDFISSTHHLDLVEEAIYRRLLDRYYLDEEPISGDIREIARSIRAKGQEEVVQAILDEFFTLSPSGAWRQARADEEIEKYREKSRKASESASVRWSKTDGKGSESGRNASGMRSHKNRTPYGMLTKNQEPRTNNQKPGQNKRGGSAPSTLPPDYIVDVMFTPPGDIVSEVAEAATVSEKEVIEWSIGFAAHNDGKGFTRRKLVSELVKWVDRERRLRK